METYIVTGAAGFVGNNMVRRLISEGKRVRLLLRRNKKAEMYAGLPVEIVYGDILNRYDLLKLFSDENGCVTGENTIFIHAAAIVSIGGKSKDLYDVNVTGTANVVSVCKEMGVKKLIYVSSVHAIPEMPHGQVNTEVNEFSPEKVVGAYAKTKAEASALVMRAAAEGLNAALVHPSGIVGVNDFSNTLLTQMALDFYNGRIPASVKGGYDFVDVRDVADGIMRIIERDARGSFLLTGSFVAVSELLKIFASEMGVKEIKTEMPMWIARVGLPFLLLGAKITRSRPLYTAYSLYTLGSNALFSHEKAARELGYKPRPFKESAADIVKDLRERGMLAADAVK